MKVLRFFTKSILSTVVLALAIVDLIVILISSNTSGFVLASLPLLVVLEVAIAALVCGAMFLKGKGGYFALIATALQLAAVALMMVVFGNLISQRAILAAAQFTYDKVNTTGWVALITSIVAVVGNLVSAIILAVKAFIAEKN